MRAANENWCAFSRYVGVDYSGAKTPSDSLKGLRVYVADGPGPAREITPPPSPRRYWTRRGIAQWMVERLAESSPTLIGIDHGFSFPRPYFQEHQLPLDWPLFLEDFQRHWPTDIDHMYVDFVRDGLHGNGAARMGNTRWRRLTEMRCGGKSVFHFDVQGSVAKSTHSGIPWLRYLRKQFGAKLHFWPFDGWEIPAGRSALVEVYPALWKHAYAQEGRTSDQQDAYAVATWLRDADRDGRLNIALHPNLTSEEKTQAGYEGWILGVG